MTEHKHRFFRHTWMQWRSPWWRCSCGIRLLNPDEVYMLEGK